MRKLAWLIGAILVWVGTAAPASALIGNSPLVVFPPGGTPNLYGGFEIETSANKGIVQAAERDVFAMRVSGEFATSSAKWNLEPQDGPLTKSENDKLAGGDTVALLLCVDLPAELTAKIKEALDRGEEVTWSIRIELVLIAAAGDKVLDSTEASGTLTPTLTPTLAPVG